MAPPFPPLPFPSLLAVEEPTRKVAEEVVVPGDLIVRLYAHTLETQRGPLEAWTFVSAGLWAVGQKELIFTVKRAPGERDQDYPRDLLSFYRTVYAFAREGRLVDVGGFSQIRPTSPGFLGRDEFHCVVYLPYQPLAGVPVAGPSVTALITTANECDALKYGHTRVMARFGRAERFYPTAPWTDRERAEIIGPDDDEGTVLEKVDCARVAEASVRRERDDHVVLTMGRGAHSWIQEVLARMRDSVPIALLVTIDPIADACLVWQPKQKGVEAICVPGSVVERVTANFLAFATGGDQDVMRIVEDGIFLFMTPPTWEKVKLALEQSEPLKLPRLGNGFEIVWTREEEIVWPDPK